MFDISFSQLTLIFIIALVVLGPSRLPGVVKTLAGWLRTLRRLTTRMQNELNQELRQLELQEDIRKIKKAMPDTTIPGLEESMDELRGVTASISLAQKENTPLRRQEHPDISVVEERGHQGVTCLSESSPTNREVPPV